jgi:hypothetical protein
MKLLVNSAKVDPSDVQDFDTLLALTIGMDFKDR